MPNRLATSNVTDLILEAKEIARHEIGDVAPPVQQAAKWPIACNVGAGLEDAPAAESRIGVVDGERGQLVYRGFEIFDLAAFSTYEETSYLLIHGALPTAEQLAAHTASLRGAMGLLPVTLSLMKSLPILKMSSMAMLEAAVMGAHAAEAEAGALGDGFGLSAVHRLIAQLMTGTGIVARLRAGLDPIEPDPALSHAANLIYVTTGHRPGPVEERIMDVALILHADHGMNASTFTAMVVTSTLSDAFFATSAGLGALKGPLHGGANEAVLDDLLEIGSAAAVEEWFEKGRATKRKVMGMGHREYKAYDPRARVLKPLARMLAAQRPDTAKLFETAEALETLAVAKMGGKGIFPNVDFYSGLCYTAMGIETAMFTPLFAVSRVAGWMARCTEYRKNNRIFRPGEYYIGDVDKDYVAIADRA